MESPVTTQRRYVRRDMHAPLNALIFINEIYFQTAACPKHQAVDIQSVFGKNHFCNFAFVGKLTNENLMSSEGFFLRLFFLLTSSTLFGCRKCLAKNA
jgi:hypothetical protein